MATTTPATTPATVVVAAPDGVGALVADRLGVPALDPSAPAPPDAFARAGAVLLDPGTSLPGGPDAARAVVDAAVAAGAARLVYVSVVGAAVDATYGPARDHYALEQYVRASGLTYTVLQPSAHLDDLPALFDADGVARGAAAGPGKVGWVTRADAADVALAVLGEGDDRHDDSHDDSHDDAAYVVSGPEALALLEVAVTVEEATGRSAAYLDQTPDEAEAYLRGRGLDDDAVARRLDWWRAVAAEEFRPVSDVVARVTGHPPTGLAAFVEAHPDAWAHLPPG